jgi:hypothetical protein
LEKAHGFKGINEVTRMKVLNREVELTGQNPGKSKDQRMPSR